MQTLHFAVDIDAPVSVVWSTMLDDETYREWTSEFGEGGHYQGDWSEGSTIRFLGAEGSEDEGGVSGMVATVVENRPLAFISLEYTGQVVRGVDDLTSDDARQWVGLHENYTFSDHRGATSVEVDVDTADEYADFFTAQWPRALERLKELAER